MGEKSVIRRRATEQGERMRQYPKYATTVIGAYSVPRWFEPLDRLVTMGQLHPDDMADAQYRVMQAAVVEQEAAGIDVITGGETHRRTHNGTRHPTRCSIISGKRYPHFMVIPDRSQS